MFSGIRSSLDAVALVYVNPADSIRLLEGERDVERIQYRTMVCDRARPY